MSSLLLTHNNVSLCRNPLGNFKKKGYGFHGSPGLMNNDWLPDLADNPPLVAARHVRFSLIHLVQTELDITQLLT